MTLAFSTHLNGKPTLFIDKIWQSLEGTLAGYEFLNYHQSYLNKFKYDWDGFPSNRSYKKHTIREDASNRWKVGNKIHFVINNRSKNRFQFAPVIPVKAIQYIKIKYIDSCEFPTITIVEDGKLRTFLKYDKVSYQMYFQDLTELAHNDGFETHQDFLAYFDKDFMGKLIHWTDFKY